MKASDFKYRSPASLADALELLDQGADDISILAGGQSLMPMMNFRLAQPDMLVDINGVSELSFIREAGETIEIGAMTRYSELEKSSLVCEHIPLFSLALPHIAHSAIRNRGTIGGSAALADPAAEMPALLLALDAELTLVSRNGERTVKANDFFLGLYHTALEENELIKSISVCKPVAKSRFGFYELARRHGDYAMAGVALSAKSVNPVDEMRIAFFGISDRAMRVPDAEMALQGKSRDEGRQTALEAIRKLDFHGDLHADASAKRHLAQIVFKRALEGMMA